MAGPLTPLVDLSFSGWRSTPQSNAKSQFKMAVESAGLTGLKIVEVWNTQEGGIPRKWEW